MIKGYETRSFVYWFVWIYALLACVFVLLYFVIPINNIHVPHTWFLNPATPGASLYSARAHFVAVSIRIGIIARIIALCAIFFMIGYRKSYVPFGIFVIAAILWFFTYTALSDQYAHCNGQGQYGNICNSKKLCCVHEILINPANHCPTAIDCAVPVLLEDVEPDANFLWLYWLHFWMIIMDVFWIVWILVFASAGTAGTAEKEEAETEEPTESTEPTEPPLPTAPTAGLLLSGLAPRRMHNLRQRKK